MPQRLPPRLVLVGAGLQNGLIALAVLQARPDADVLLLERAGRAGGNHTWSWHAADVPHALAPLGARLAEHRWPVYDVRFPELARRVPLGYASLSSRHFDGVLADALGRAPNARLRTHAVVEAVAADHVVLADGERIAADLVIDARGPSADAGPYCGYQKFVGLELDLIREHGLVHPLLMDATVEQIDGFRFLYVLPLGPTRLLVEDTIFSARAELDVPGIRARVLEEAEARGWSPRSVLREEQGVLPMPWAGRGPALQHEGPLQAGYGGRWFHPATGYSMPIALRLADVVARHADDPARLFASRDYRALVRHVRGQARFARFLNRLLFTGVQPDWQWRVFQQFYRLPDEAIARFYRLALRSADRARMLVGRPPRGFSVRTAFAGSAVL